jgi:hypothetical protein
MWGEFSKFAVPQHNKATETRPFCSAFLPKIWSSKTRIKKLPFFKERTNKSTSETGLVPTRPESAAPV